MPDNQSNPAAQTTEFIFPPPAIVSLPVVGSALRFPVTRVYCVGRNYAAHAVEMGHDPRREPPFFFQKNPRNLLIGEDTLFPYPGQTSDVHHEIELVVALSRGGKGITVEKAQECVWGYAVGIDMTRRDLQGEAKKLGRPWEVAKAFDYSAPCAPLVPATRIGHPFEGEIWLDLNGQRKQSGNLNQMLWKVPHIIAHLSGFFALQPGDLIMTGTPAGVGPVQRGDVMNAGIEGVGRLNVSVF